MPATPPPDLRFRIAAKSDCDVILRALQELAASLGVPERLRSTRAAWSATVSVSGRNSK